MATLRNKTTDSGVIIRWKPHPDHNRPSTYQVTPSAVSFLAEIGFSVPSPGEEVEVPWDVCRPLRVLGDLHFKSETPGEVETGGIGDVDEGYGRSLTNEQQAQLRNYIETHSQYGSASKSLTGELSSLPENDEEGDAETEVESSSNGTDSREDLSKLNTKDVVVGRIDRLSSAGNAILRTETGEEWNLGPLTEDVVGEEVPVAVQNGTWGLCLAPRFWSAEFAEQFAHQAGPAYTSLIKSYFPDGEPEQLQTDLSEFDVAVDDVITVDITNSGGQIILGNYRNQVAKVVSEKPVPRSRLNVRVLGHQGPLLTVEPASSDATSLNVGETIEVVISRVDADGGYGVHEKTLIQIPGDEISTGTRVHAGITAVNDQMAIAAIAALPDTDRPREDDAVWVEESSLTRYPDVPVTVPDALTGVSTPLRLEVKAVETDHVDVSGASWDMLPGISVEDTIDAEQIEWTDDGTLFARDGVPILVDGFHPDFGGECRIALTGQADGCLRGSLVEDSRPTGKGKLTDYIEVMQEGHWRINTGEFESAADLFETAIDHAPDDSPRYWVDARACQAYATIAALIRDQRFDGSQRAIADTREELASVRDEAREAVGFCFRELAVLEHTVAAGKAWFQTRTGDDAASPRKARATAKRELRQAAEKGDSILNDEKKGDLNRQTLHPALVLSVQNIVAAVDRVHDTVTQFLETVALSETIQWASLTEVEVETADEPLRLVEPFDPGCDVPDGLPEYRAHAEEAATPTDEVIDFRDMTRKYGHTTAIQQYVRCRADGTCEGCENDAPFEDTQGRPYLELHHVDEFEMSGPDVPDRVVALCPTCHTRVHAGADGEEVNAELRAKLEAGLGELGVSDSGQDK